MAAPPWTETSEGTDYPAWCDDGVLPDPATNPDGDPNGKFIECAWTGYVGDLHGYGELDIVEEYEHKIIGRCPQCRGRIVVLAR